MVHYTELDQFKDDFFKEMRELWEEKRGCDVTIIIGEEKFLCHRVILSLASTYFKKLFYGDFKEKDLKEVTLHDIDVKAFKRILKAIYTGALKLNSKKSPYSIYQMLKTSSFFNITAIEEACVSEIMESKCTDHLIEICMLSNVIGQDELFSECLNRIADDYLHFCKVDAFKSLPLDILKLILSRVDGSVHSDILLSGIMRWSKFNRVDNKTIMTLLEVAKLTNISPAMLASLIMTANTKHKSGKNRKKPRLSDDNNDYDDYHDYYDDPYPAIAAYVSSIDTENCMKGCIGFRLNTELMRWCEFTFSFKNSCDYYVKLATVGNADYNLCYKQFFDRNVLTKKVEGEDFKVVKRPPILMRRYHMIGEENQLFVFSVEPHQQFISTYDCDLNTWGTVSIPDDEFLWREYTVAHCNSKIYIFGMKKVTSNFTKKYVSCLDCRTLSFSILAEMPDLHNGAAACVHGGKIYLCGSSNDEESGRCFSSFDIKTKEWCSLEKMRHGRANSHRVIYYEKYLYVLDCSPLKDPERYNITTNKWSSVPPIPSCTTYTIEENCHKSVVGELLEVAVAVGSLGEYML